MEFDVEALAVFALAIAVAAVGLSSWHVMASEEQLRLSRLTEAETRKTLNQIRREMAATRQISDDLANKINERITAVLDTNALAASQGHAIEQALSELLKQDATGTSSMRASAESPLN